LSAIARHKRSFSKPGHSDKANDSGNKADAKFCFKIHRRLAPILERIGTPEPTPFIPDPFQLEALDVLRDSDVLVTAPTGAGKTYIAIKAIERLFTAGRKSWYASPLKALSNAKYQEFSEMFGAANVGILTGDRKENPHAPIIVGTTEILRNQLYDTMHRGEDLSVDLVVLDEAHYLGDQDRGVVWEEVLIYLPSRVKLLMLSATIQNAEEICGWLEWLRQKSCRWVAAHQRPVPLYPLFLFPSGELSPLSNRRGLYARIRTVEPSSLSRRSFLDIPRLMDGLRKANLLPAIFFLKSRADCEKAISMSPRFVRSKGDRKDADSFHDRVEQLLKIYPFLRKHAHLSILKKARVGAHHGGQLPHWKLFLEKLMQEGYLEAIFSTSTVAAGVNFPARTVVIPQSDRFNGKEFTQLSATDLLQMTGRAGRRGMDEIGFVFVVPGPYQDPQLIHDLLNSSPDSIQSQIRVNFSMVLNLLLSHNPEEIQNLFASSFATYQNLLRDPHAAEELKNLRQELGEWLREAGCGSIEQMALIRPQFFAYREKLCKARKVRKNQAAGLALQNLLVPGRTFRNRRGVTFIAVALPQLERGTVEAVRAAFPLHSRRGQIRTYSVQLQRISELGETAEIIPPLNNRSKWQALISHLISRPFHPISVQEKSQPLPAELVDQGLMGPTGQSSALPCESCDLFGPCQKQSSHPFSLLLVEYFERQAQLSSIQDELWRSFMQHFQFLQRERYIDKEGHLTADGFWASKLRLDQPLLISEGIRSGLFPTDQPELLAALIAPFVMDRDRPGDMQLSTLVWKYPDIAKPFFKMLHGLHPLREQLKEFGFSIPPLPFWTMATVYQWALGESWEEVRNISGTAEGDLAMVILRTADHLRQIESLTETHPRLAALAHRAIGLILREPVLVE